MCFFYFLFKYDEPDKKYAKEIVSEDFKGVVIAKNAARVNNIDIQSNDKIFQEDLYLILYGTL